MHYHKKTNDEMIRLVLESRKYQNWRKRVESYGNRILQLDVLSVVSRSPGTWYVAFLDCILLTPEGKRISRCLTLRGESVVVIPLLQCLDDNHFYTVMVEQRCICDGDLHTGFPAGNLEEGECLKEMACQELIEETGLEISPEELVKLSDGIILNSSLSDDLIYFYGFRKDVTIEWLNSIDNSTRGIHEEGEYIQVKVVSLVDCYKMSTTSTLIGLKLIEKAFCISI